MHILLDDLKGDQIALFLQEHLEEMRTISSEESVHALDLDSLRRPEITFWSVWDNQNLLGCGALKETNPTEAEIKSMRTSKVSKRKGVASFLLEYMIAQAQKRGYQRINLETGSQPFFEPARKLYVKHGFRFCAPFGSYQEDPESVFMELLLS